MPGLRFGAQALGLLSLGLAARGQEVDEVHPEVTLERLAFASCVKAWRPVQKKFWEQLEAFAPQAFLWTGDAVYANSTHVDALPGAFAQQRAVPAYDHFLSYAAEHGVQVDGVWDDHDLGVNDGGGEVDHLPERQEHFLDFLGYEAGHPRRQRRGLYKSLVLGSGRQKVKIIMLDVRSFRDHYIIPSVGAYFHWYRPIGRYMPFIASGLRFVSQMRLPYFGWRLVDLMGESSTVLGARQWAWFEEQLANSDARAHIIVSSTQVLTSNPIFEGWSHFPRERQRLLDLLEKHAVSGAVLVSGDVHHGELARWPYASQNETGVGDARVLAMEITASGVTHSLSKSPKTQNLYPPILTRFHEHRVQPKAFYAGLNFGTLEIKWPEDTAASPEILLAVRDVASGSPACTAQFRPAEEGGSILLST